METISYCYTGWCCHISKCDKLSIGHFTQICSHIRYALIKLVEIGSNDYLILLEFD